MTDAGQHHTHRARTEQAGTIRDFVPILVERAARTKLTSSAPRYRA